MAIRILPIKKYKVSDIAEIAANLLKAGGIIAVPTDTLYGLATLAQNTLSIQRLYSIKERNSAKPIAVTVADVADIFKWCHVTISDSLLRDLLPGAVTLVFERRAELNPELNPDTNLIGVRIPENEFLRSVCRQLNTMPVALTSANLSSKLSPLCIGDFVDLWPQLDAIFDGEALGDVDPHRLGSTVIDFSVKGCYSVIREGCCYNNVKNIIERNYNLQRVSNGS